MAGSERYRGKLGVAGKVCQVWQTLLGKDRVRMGPRRSGTGRLGTPGGLKTPEMAPMGGTPPKLISNSILLKKKETPPKCSETWKNQ